MIVSVRLMDGRSINLPVDSASTSREICQVISNKVQLKDSFGFSLYVAVYEKVHLLPVSVPEEESVSMSISNILKRAVGRCLFHF